MEEIKNRLGNKNIEHYKGIFIINSIYEYMQVLDVIRNENKNKELWYRGQSNARYQLFPNILRYAKEVASVYGDEFKPRDISWFARGQTVIYPKTTKMLDDFKNKAKFDKI